ncbi:MAG: class I SAM-dependent methyltransferase [Solirubrobacterales bacterium]|nr:class I SAM-dependent methyltransferase [Solirubrobacterales bacterium]
MSAKAIWHDVECGSYSADLPLWEELARAGGGPVLDLGCGTGRVALHLARRGHRVVGIDLEPALIESLRERGRGLPLEGVVADARDFRLEDEFPLAVAPMQVMQLLPDSTARVACLRRVASQLRPGGRFAAAILEQMPEPDDSPPPLPDVREVDGWIYSSLAVEVAVGDGEIVIHRLRQTVSPVGELGEEDNQVRIATFPAAQLQAEAAEAGLLPVARHEISPTDIHVGSTVVVLGKAG